MCGLRIDMGEGECYNKQKGGIPMPIIEGCHEGKHTPKLLDVLCPNCGEEITIELECDGDCEACEEDCE